MSFNRKIPWTRQPQYPVEIDRSNPLTQGLVDVVLPLSLANRTLIRGYDPVVVGAAVVADVGVIGRNVTFPALGANVGIRIADDPDDLIPSTTDATIFIVRRSKDTTARATMAFGYDDGATSRVLAHAPWSDGNIYWDFGGDGVTQRISTAFVKSTEVDYLVFVAGGGKGREIWRNGKKIAGDTTKTGVRAATAGHFRIGSYTTTANATDHEEVYLFGIANRAWSDSEIVSWTKTPWQIFPPLDRRIFVDAATGAFSQSVGGALSFSGANIKLASKIQSGAITPTGAPSKNTGRVISGSLSFSGVIATLKSFVVSLVGALSFSGATLKTPSKLMAGALSFTSAAIKSISKLLSATVSFAGSVSSLKSYLISVSGSLSFGGQAIKSTSKLLVGTLAFSGLVRKSTSRVISGALAFSASVSKITAKILSGVVSFSSTLTALIGGLIASLTAKIRILTARKESRILTAKKESRVLK